MKEEKENITMIILSIFVKRLLLPSIDVYSDVVYTFCIGFGIFPPIEIENRVKPINREVYFCHYPSFPYAVIYRVEQGK